MNGEQKQVENFPAFYYSDGRKFVQGRHQFGTLITTNKIFDGEFKEGKLHGIGCERTLNPGNNLLYNEFIGSFRNGRKNGEGQRFYDNGLYDGTWKENQRSGRGIMWFDSGELYFGEWKSDVYDGAGVLVKANGNRFEGSFSNGMKHGEGTYYHCKTGQVQKGVWMNDVCRCSMMQDEAIRFEALFPTPFPIPEVKLENPSMVVAEEFGKVLSSINKFNLHERGVN